MRPIADYALLGDCHSAALVSRDGAVDWACFPRFDSPSSFARILDARRGGTFTLGPGNVVATRRRYLDETNVLRTVLTTSGGDVELTDCMPVSEDLPAGGRSPRARHAVLRRARCLHGEVVLRLVVAPRFEYGSLVPRFRRSAAEVACVVGGADAIEVTATRPIDVTDGRVRALWRLRAGEEVWVEARWCRAGDPHPARAPGAAAFQSRLDETLTFWRQWATGFRADPETASGVRRSALVLKALTYAPTGAVVAAPTTSLPERIGGERNWDYRYTWIRDSTLTLTSLMITGFRSEADSFKAWLERTGAGRPEDLQIMYGIKGRRSLPEIELGHLSGHRSSAPVRIGNGAAGQTQLDCYGQLLEAAWLYARLGGSLSADNWRVLCGYADVVARRWREADQGIWEIRDEARHFLHSKLHCWLALDRAVRLSKLRGKSGRVGRWMRERAAVQKAILEDAEARGWFSQALGSDVPDASALVVPALGFLPASHPLVLQTIEVVTKELGDGPLLHRYRDSDGLEGSEGAFLLCSFWLADALLHAGRLTQAEALLEELGRLGNDVGLYAEEADPTTLEPLGNFPQAFTHMALITSFAHLAAARRNEIPPQTCHDFAAFLLDRRIAQGGSSHPDGTERMR